MQIKEKHPLKGKEMGTIKYSGSIKEVTIHLWKGKSKRSI